jgi:hypothetical protein
LPKRKRGAHFPKPPPSTLDPIAAAAADVRRMRAIWKQHYGRKNRRPDDGPSAEDIAADRWSDDPNIVTRNSKHGPIIPPQIVSIDEILNYMKRSAKQSA